LQREKAYPDPVSMPTQTGTDGDPACQLEPELNQWRPNY